MNRDRDQRTPAARRRPAALLRAVERLAARVALVAALVAAIVPAAGCAPLTDGCNERGAQHTVPVPVVHAREERTAREEARQPSSQASDETAQTAAAPSDLLAYVHESATTVLLLDFDAFRADWRARSLGTLEARHDALIRAGRQLDLLGNDPRTLAWSGAPLSPSRVHEFVLASRTVGVDWVGVTNLDVTDERTQSALRDGGDALPLRGQGGARGTRVAQRGDLVIFGAGALFEFALAADATPGDHALDPKRHWPEGWAALDDDAIVRFIATDYFGLTSRDRLPFPSRGEAPAQRVALSAAADASVTLVVDGDQRAWLPLLLGAARDRALAQATFDADTLPPQLRDWTRYTQLLAQSLFDRLELRDTGTQIVAALPAPTCGGRLQNLILAGALAGLLYQVERDDLLRPSTIPLLTSLPEPAPLEDSLERCPQTGLAPRTGSGLPLAALDVATSTDAIATLLLVDFERLLPGNVETAFGLLPFSLDRESLNQAFIEDPFGVRASISGEAQTTPGHIAMYVEKRLGSEEPSVFFSLSPAASAFLPTRLETQLVPDEQLGHIAGTPDLLARYAQGAPPTDTWAVLREAIDDGDLDQAAGVLVVPPVLFQTLNAQLELEPRTSEMLEAIDYATLILGHDMSVRTLIQVRGEADLLRDRLEDDIGRALSDLFRQADFAARAHRGGAIFPSLAQLLSSDIHITSTGERAIELELGALGHIVAGTLIVSGIYGALAHAESGGGEALLPTADNPWLPAFLRREHHATGNEPPRGGATPEPL